MKQFNIYGEGFGDFIKEIANKIEGKDALPALAIVAIVGIVAIWK